jgi:hypothetical protein
MNLECEGGMKEILQTQNKDGQRDDGEGSISQDRIDVDWGEAQFFEVRLRLIREGPPPAGVTRRQFSCS